MKGINVAILIATENVVGNIYTLGKVEPFKSKSKKILELSKRKWKSNFLLNF